MNGELVGARHTCYLQGQCLNTRIEFACKELDMLAVNNLKQECFGLHRACVSKLTVTSLNATHIAIHRVSFDFNSTLLRKTYLLNLTVRVHVQLFL